MAGGPARVVGPQGFLRPFMQAQLDAHGAPTRKGAYTQRGDRVAFSLGKFTATVLTALTTTPLDAIARMSGTSYGQLRNWRMERRFRETVERLRDEFVAHFWREADRIRLTPPPPSLAEDPDDLLDQVSIALWATSSLADATLYATEVEHRLIQTVGTPGTARWYRRGLVLQELLERRGESFFRPEIIQGRRQAVVAYVTAFINDILRDPEASDDQRAQAVLYTAMLRRLLAERPA